VLAQELVIAVLKQVLGDVLAAVTDKACHHGVVEGVLANLINVLGVVLEAASGQSDSAGGGSGGRGG
jgi:hypothetical protein